MNFTQRFWRRALGPYLALMLISSLIPMAADSSTPDFLLELDPNIQNLLHIPMFALLIWILLEAHTPPASRKLTARLALMIAAAIVYGVLLEALQAFVPGRYASIDDMLFNALGVAIGGLTWFLLASTTVPPGEPRSGF